MRFGRSVPVDSGFLPVFSVNTKKEAIELLTATCPRNLDGEFVSRELAQEQTLENLEAFSQKLELVYDLIQKNKRAAATTAKATNGGGK